MMASCHSGDGLLGETAHDAIPQEAIPWNSLTDHKVVAKYNTNAESYF